MNSTENRKPETESPAVCQDDSDHPREHCGVFGIYGHPEAARLTYFGLYALQHRGQESCGIVVGDGSRVTMHRGLGLVPEVFNPAILDQMPGHLAIGHVRYSTTGSTLLINAQPFVVQHGGQMIAIGHNGTLTNYREVRCRLEEAGSIFQSTMDTEVIVHLMARHKGDLVESLTAALGQVQGSYSLVISTADQLIAARDPYGFRPLCLGRLNGSWVVASESCALDLVQADYWREVEPGEIVVMDAHGLHSHKPLPPVPPRHCIFEYIYFARPDSLVYGQSVYLVRKRLGAALAREHPLKADLVMPFPDSGTYAALGYTAATGLPFEMGVIRNHYVGRTFIQPSQTMRDFSVRIKLNPVRDILKGQRVIVIEDSIIRGTTTRSRVKSLREAGAKEISMLVSCPPHRYPCYYGIDFSSKGELIASQKEIDQIGDFLGLDYLGYLSLEGMVGATLMDHSNFCLSCFSGEYPVALESDFSKTCFENDICSPSHNETLQPPVCGRP
ncbi:MAG: amidophosphoribosyltransferase [Syntrophobacterales bacterium]|jgi:amidophosphoribosyltransferase|nr:amidophosphoribosyltransferase [Syntrophobacterales bacterium]